MTQLLDPKTASVVDSVTFDFTAQLEAGETINETPLSITETSTPNGAAVLTGAAEVVGGVKVKRGVAGGTLGSRYAFTAIVTTSLGRTLELAAFMDVRPSVVPYGDGFDLIRDYEVAAALSTTANENVQRITAAVNKWVKRVCGRAFERVERTVAVEGYGVNYIFLPEAPIIEVAEVRIDCAGVFGLESIVSDVSRFVFDSSREDFRLRWLDGIFPESPRAAQVKFTGGHVGGAIPGDLHDALIVEACNRYRAIGTERAQQISLGDFSMTRFDSEADPQVLATVNRYRAVI